MLGQSVCVVRVWKKLAMWPFRARTIPLSKSYCPEVVLKLLHRAGLDPRVPSSP